MKKLIKERFNIISILISVSKYVTVITVDCDVVITGLADLVKSSNVNHFYMGYGPKLNDIFQNFELPGLEVKNAIAFFHKFAQCDMVSSFYKIDKEKYEFYSMIKDVDLTCLCSLQSHKEYAETENAHLHPICDFQNASSIFCCHSSAHDECLHLGRLVGVKLNCINSIL